VHFVPATLPAGAANRLAIGIDRVDVLLQLTIDSWGAVTAVEVVRGAGEPFDGAAQDAAGRFRFDPAKVDGEPTAVAVPYTYVFELERAPPAPPTPTGTAAVSGDVLMKGTRAPVAGVMVVLEPKFDGPPPIETLTDAEGRFAFDGVTGGKWLVRISLEGDDEEQQLIFVEEGVDKALLTVYASQSGVTRYRTVARDKGTQRVADKVQLIDRELKTVPGTFGDPTRVVATLPGVARSPFGLGYYVVRGADFANTGMFIDGFAAPLLYHFFAGPAVIHPEFVGAVDFYPGGYPVDFGRFSAGLMNVRSKDVPRDRWHLMVDVDLLKASVFFSVPFDEGRGSIAVAGRRSYLDLMLSAVAPDAGFSLSYWDYQLRVTYAFAPETNLSVFFLGSGDSLDATSQQNAASYEEENPGDTVFGTMFHRAMVRFDHSFTRDLRMRSDSLVGYNVTELRAGGSEDFVLEIDLVSVRERLSLTYDVADWLELRAGVDFDALLFRAEVVIPSESPVGDVPDPSFESAIADLDLSSDQFGLGTFVAADFRPMACLRVLPGFRLDVFDYDGSSHVTVDPRLTVRWEALPWLTVKGGTGLYHQPPNFIEIDPQFGNPTIPPHASVQTSGGVEIDLGEGWELGVTSFYNHMFDLPIETDEVVGEGEAVRRVNLRASGLGRAYGLELLVRKRFGDWVHGWLAYTLSQSQRRSAGGSWELFDFDQTHILNLAWSLRLPWDWTIGVRFRLTSGNPTERIAGAIYDADSDDYSPTYDGKDRLPLFHQLDVRVDKRLVFDTWILEIYLDIQNVYYAKNAEFYRYSYDYAERGVVGGLPILPTLGLKAVF